MPPGKRGAEARGWGSGGRAAAGTSGHAGGCDRGGADERAVDYPERHRGRAGGGGGPGGQYRAGRVDRGAEGSAPVRVHGGFAQRVGAYRGAGNRQEGGVMISLGSTSLAAKLSQ